MGGHRWSRHLSMYYWRIERLKTEMAARPATVRNWHTATLLKDGRVLVAGGAGTGLDNGLSSAELFDPMSRER
jgi:hypothetical protein